MRVTFLGTGDSGGVPCYGCECHLCHRARSVRSLRRRPTSAFVSVGPTTLAIDAGRADLPDLITTGDLQGICLTHFHVDHVQGLFPLRWGCNDRIPVHCPDDPDGCADLYRHPGILEFRAVEPFAAFAVGPITVTPLPLYHSKPTLGYAFESGGKRLAWLSDTLGLPDATRDWLLDHRSDLAVVDCTHPPQREPPRNHNDLDRALETLADIAARQGLLVHLSHHCASYLEDAGRNLPRHVQAATDGLVVAVG